MKKSSIKKNANVDDVVAPGTVVSLKVAPCPNTMRTKLKYTERVSLTATSGIYTQQFWKLNGMFDPNYSGTGTQPEGFDQWMTLYDRFRVYKSKIKVTITTVGSTAALSSFRAVLVPQASFASENTFAGAADSPYAQQRFNQGVTNRPMVLSMTMPVSKFLGVPPQAVLEEFNYCGTSSADPSQTVYWAIYVEPLDLASSVQMFLYCEITYYADFYEHNLLDTSIAVPELYNQKLIALKRQYDKMQKAQALLKEAKEKKKEKKEEPSSTFGPLL